MNEKNWMIYGAYGYTGKLIIETAISQGYRPILAGRSADKLIPLANKWDLDYRVFDLTDNGLIEKNIKDLDIVLLTAGPFIHTSRPMVEACLRTGTNYLDITGEIPVFEQNFKFNKQAINNNVALISGVGFDVVPTDCLAKYLSTKIQDAINLEIGIAGLSSLSPGTLKTMLEHQATGLLIRKEGKLIKESPKNVLKNIKFSDKERIVVPTLWGDLVTAFHSTGIPNIVVYMSYSKNNIELGKKMQQITGNIQTWIEQNVKGPDKQTRDTSKSYIWGRVSNKEGIKVEAWLETMEPYRFTAISAVKSVENLLEINLKGSLTPSLAFGKDFILKIPESNRLDKLITTQNK